MTQFRDGFMKASPVKQIAGDRVGRLRKRAQRRSERSGETGDYDYSDMKVLKLLDKAKKIENKNFIKDLGFKKGSKRKGSKYGEDARVSASHDRPDSDSNSPLHGAYTSGAGGQAYVSNRQDFQQLQDRIAGAAISIMAGENDPQTQLERAQKRKARKQEKFDNLVKGKNLEKKEGVTDPEGNAVYFDKITGEINTRASKLQQQATKLDKKAQAAQDLLKQRAKNKRSTDKLTAAEKTEITKQNFLSEGNTEDDWNALPPKAKKEAVLDYRTYYGFN